MSTVERKLVAIVAADVVGYSRLMGAFEEETIAALRSHRSEVIEPGLAKYRGRIANTAGDSFLIEFASAVDALRFSIEAQREIARRNQRVDEDRQLVFRMGINVGDVVANGEDLLGDGVNIAARLEALAEPGGVCISRSVRDQVRDRFDVTLDDMGEVEVKNIARPVRVFRVAEAGKSRQMTVTGSKSAIRWPVIAALPAALVVALGMTTLWWSQQPDIEQSKSENVAPVPSGNPTIAVLPFVNLSGDQGQTYFADGITEDITTDLSKVSGLVVTARSATLRFRGSTEGPKVVAAKLKVGHLLEGSVRRVGEQIRIVAKLIDAKTGNQLWAERFDRNAQDVFAIQDEISERVVAELSERFKGKISKRKPRIYTPKIEAYDLYIRGRAQRIPPTPPNLAAAMKSFKKAIEIDPKFAGGYAGLSFAQILAASDSTNSAVSIDQKYQTALELAKNAIELNPEFGPGWGSLAEARFRTGDLEGALQAVQKAIELAPADSLMRARYGRFLGYGGRADEGIDQIKSALRMSPDSLPLLYFLGANYRAGNQYQLAIDALIEHRKRLGDRILPAPTTQLIAAYVQAGKIDDARREASALLKVAPKFTTKIATRIHAYKSKRDQTTFVNALRQAGIPD